jgi:hypothetical protein
VTALEQDVEHEPTVPFLTHSHHKRRDGDEPRVDERRPIWEAFWTHQAGRRLLPLFQLAPQRPRTPATSPCCAMPAT